MNKPQFIVDWINYRNSKNKETEFPEYHLQYKKSMEEGEKEREQFETLEGIEQLLKDGKITLVQYELIRDLILSRTPN